MRPRRSAVTIAMTAVGLLATGAQGASATLDGQRRTTYTHRGELDDTILTSTNRQGTGAFGKVMQPTPQDCGVNSCDITTLRLTIPRDRQSGRFEYAVEFLESGSQSPAWSPLAYVALYDSDDAVVAWLRVTPFSRAQIALPRLKPDTYRVIIYNQGGPVDFTATTSWFVNPRHPRPAESD